MARGAEAYLTTWERAVGVSNDACRDKRVIKRTGVFSKLKKGTTVKNVLLKAGQPHARLGTTFTYCAKNSKGKKVTRKVTFTASGKVRRVR
ncbi:hypothetical protein [Aeromicrobium sp. UC242_57]|uniref:hypothetical protein n=1 Tax=Aeromicrobium sp. UC242_57 TaxID=3374624 RepID=UPI003799BBE8